MVFRDARGPGAYCGGRGAGLYVYDAKLRVAELARRVWGDEDTAARLEHEAAVLRDRFDAAFWLPELGWYALGLDAEKRPIDALASNMGHLLASGLLPPERVDAVVPNVSLLRPLSSGLGHPHARRGRGGVRPARVPQRRGVATRQLADRVRPRTRRAAAGGRARLPAGSARQPRRSSTHRLPELFAGFDPPPGDAPPGAVPTLGASAGVGGRDTGAFAARAARPRARPCDRGAPRHDGPNFPYGAEGAPRSTGVPRARAPLERACRRRRRGRHACVGAPPGALGTLHAELPVARARATAPPGDRSRVLELEGSRAFVQAGDPERVKVAFHQLQRRAVPYLRAGSCPGTGRAGAACPRSTNVRTAATTKKYCRRSTTSR